ncbi:hypothetical protein AFK68_06900 [Hydrocoleum sp. CS-953]|uniref:hypothetical protein n=1 Tax=Hydrocoleum sp. CS-953 TaxID=1671698 RepID=UPI000B9C032E|nr:hypothetical protein [Hydrocoleum sp. CS-953]OZH55070.1 hypothetical protein AFK68_06900 [Hydrocoleum sp. CS-953]
MDEWEISHTISQKLYLFQSRGVGEGRDVPCNVRTESGGIGVMEKVVGGIISCPVASVLYREGKEEGRRKKEEGRRKKEKPY